MEAYLTFHETCRSRASTASWPGGTALGSAGMLALIHVPTAAEMDGFADTCRRTVSDNVAALSILGH
jgi:hypothetical protein|eukprot:COSAG01_NODE_15278_length_1355_cov_1.474522_1_plen_67_part_00